MVFSKASMSIPIFATQSSLFGSVESLASGLSPETGRCAPSAEEIWPIGSGRPQIGASVRAILLSCMVVASIAAVSAEEMAPPPGAGLKSNHNYYLYNGGNPILGLVVKIELTKDVVCDDIGFHIQLNANSPLGSQTTWQQYVMGFNPDFKDQGRSLGPVVGCSIEYFAKPNSFDTGHKIPPNVAPVRHLPSLRTLPAGARFVIAMIYEGDNVSGAEFTYVEKGGKDRHGWTIPVPPPTPPYPGPAAPSSVRAPIIAFQVDIVGKSSGDTAIMKSGEGEIIYSSSGPMTVVAKKPPSAGAITAEKANSAYGELPVGPGSTFTQTFTVVPDASK